MLPRLILIGITALLEVIIMNKFDSIDSNVKNKTSLRPTYPDIPESRNGLEYFYLIRYFWYDEFNYFSDKSLKEIVNEIYECGDVMYYIDDLLYPFCKKVAYNACIKKDMDDIIYYLNYYCTWKQKAYIGNSGIIKYSSHKDIIIDEIIFYLREYTFDYNDIELRNLIEEYKYKR